MKYIDIHQNKLYDTTKMKEIHTNILYMAKDKTYWYNDGAKLNPITEEVFKEMLFKYDEQLYINMFDPEVVEW